jgi:hypothetical protein
LPHPDRIATAYRRDAAESLSAPTGLPRSAQAGIKLERHEIQFGSATAAGRYPAAEAELGVAPHIIEAVLRGSKAGVAGVYNRATYEKEKRAALVLWAEHVLATVEGLPPKVAPIGRSTN